MKPSIAINILSPRTLAEKHEGRVIFQLLGQCAPNLVPERYDLVEPIKKVFTPDDLDTVLEDWQWGFLWKRKKPASSGSAWLATGPRPKHSWLTLDVIGYAGEIETSLSFFKACCRYVEADFASMHLMTENEIEGGKANGTFSFNNVQRTKYMHAITTFMLEKYIPDLYWGTVLGRPYVKLFGRERILSSPAARVEELTNDVFYLQLTDDIRDLETRFDQVEAVRQAIKIHLGKDAFFDEALGLDHKYRVPFFSLNGRNTEQHPEPVDESKTDEDLLSEAMMPLATRLLREIGTFEPFGAVVGLDRSVGMVSFAAEDRAELVGMIRALARTKIQEKGLRAVGICADIKGMRHHQTHAETNALQVIYEDFTGKAYTVFIPYTWSESEGFQFTPSYSVTNEPVLFAEKV